MAFSLVTSFPICTFPGRTQCKRFSSSHRLNVSSALQCKATAEVSGEVDVVRRSGNFRPTIWDDDYVQSLRSDFRRDGSYNERASKLQGEVSEMLCGVVDSLEKLKLIDTLQRLGLSRHFQHEINTTLKNISADCGSVPGEKQNLHATSLEFRLLRQHGYMVNQDVFTSFMDEVGNIKASFSQDWKGLLNLYEASYLLIEGETILENGRESAANLLKECLKQTNDPYLRMLVEHALELPLHWRTSRLEARWFIDVYEKNKDKNPIVLEFAILDYNTVQAIHQDDLRSVSAWWKDLGLCEKFNFARDRLMENFLWGVGIIITPQSGKSRIVQTKVGALVTFIDDIYDVYGTLEELELFTDAVERWDINEIQKLPTYMKICYHALYNSISEMAFHILKEQGIDVLPFLKKLYEIQRGDVPKSIQCYMYENEASEEEAREHIKKLIEAAWKKINKEQMAESPFSRTFIKIAMDFARVSHMMYQNGDGYGIEDGDTKDRVLSLFVNPIPCPK
ncbi:hypothetical protein GQ457_01G004230 [Hibiscus cannabinus]